jgi:hypothetical protein
LSLDVSNLGVLDHELSDVGEECAAEKVDFSEEDGGKELCEDLIDIAKRLYVRVRGGGGESGGKTVRFGGLLGERDVECAERGMRRSEVHAAAAGFRASRWVQREDSGSVDGSDMRASGR